jgi:hemerythrin-like domain-containing protein
MNEKMGIQIGAQPDRGFDDPIGMLKDCHRRIERFLHILGVVAHQAQGRALTQEETSAVQSALSYFRTGGQRHTADEEESLFPRLRTTATAESFKELGRLESDHDEANGLHRTIEKLYTAWIEAGKLGAEEGRKLLAVTERLKHLYQEHIQLEEQVVFPRAAQALDSSAIAAMGIEFRARRT